MISHWLGWISLVIGLLLLAKFFGRLSKSKIINQYLRKIHKPLGNALIAIAVIHGVLSFAGNTQALLQGLTGLLALLSAFFLARTFYAKKKLKNKWLQIHKHLTLLFLVLIVIHISLSLV